MTIPFWPSAWTYRKCRWQYDPYLDTTYEQYSALKYHIYWRQLAYIPVRYWFK